MASIILCRFLQLGFLKFVYGLRSQLTGDLLDIDDDKFSRFERGKTDDHIDDALVNIRLGSGRGVALDKVGVLGRLTLERPLAV